MSDTLTTTPPTAAPATPSLSASPAPAWRIPPQQLMLLCLLALEVVLFSFFGTNFFTWDNFATVTTNHAELGLLALALTPVIATGGIDLSVGSLLGLCAVLFGKMWRDGGLPPWAAGCAAVGIGALAGALNAGLITRLRLPPLIVTLGSYSLFRGVAEGLTRGVDNFTNFPASFLRLGHGAVGAVPIPVLILAAGVVLFWVLQHWSTIGRTLSAIGYSPEGARHAGIRVGRRVALAYVLTGICAGLGAVLYTARVGQAKADAGTGYELDAITAVVLGGTSIFGGRASVGGTVLGLLCIAFLQAGLRLADVPEGAGILTGLLLLIAIGLDWRPGAPRAAPATAAGGTGRTGDAGEEGLNMKNSQLAVLCAVILAAAFVVVAGNYVVVRSIVPQPPKPMTIAMMPKSKGNAYFIACRRGADEAAKQLGVNLLWDGPTDPDPARQNEIIDTWITRGVDVIAVACENRDAVSTVLDKARKKGIKVVTFDSDAQPQAREFFVNQATPQGIGYTLMDDAADVMGGKGDFAIITASLTAGNMNEWRKFIERRRAEKYPDIQMVDVRACDDIQAKAFEEAKTIMNAKPNVKLLMAICSPAVPGAAEAVKQAGRQDVKVVGLGLPNDNKPYVKAGITPDVVLWNTMDLGYLTVRVAHDVKTGDLMPGDKFIDAGRLGKKQIEGDNVILGKPVTFTKDNIDQYDF